MIQQDTLTRFLKWSKPDFANSLGWSPLADSPVDDEPLTGNTGQIAITGRQGAGKKTLCSTLLGWSISALGGEPVQRYGRVMLVDLPDEAGSDDGFTLHFMGAQVVLYLVDVNKPVTDADFAWVARLRALNACDCSVRWCWNASAASTSSRAIRGGIGRMSRFRCVRFPLLEIIVSGYSYK